MTDPSSLSIISPATGQEKLFPWTTCKTGEFREENGEIVDILSWIVEDVDELSRDAELTKLLRNVDKTSYSSVHKLCTFYNNAITTLREKWSHTDTKPSFLHRKATQPHVQFILYQCYNRAVAEPDKLNQYPPFSPQVYGETSFELISQMIDTVSILPDESFIDLGSGVGQVVLQVAACSDAKYCYGIEKAEYPAACACRLDSEFRHWMEFYGKPYRPFTLERGDFLSVEYQDQITSAGVLFANNFAFGPEVDHQLKQRFANLKEGARIISSKAFCPLNFRITDRNLGDIGSIMHVSCLNPIQDAVSWTDKPFSYYVHTIDRSLLERYFLRLKNPKLKDDTETVRRDRKGRVISDSTTKEQNGTSSTSGSGKDLFAPVVNRSHARSHSRRSRSVDDPSTIKTRRRTRPRVRQSKSKRQQLKSKSMKQLHKRRPPQRRSPLSKTTEKVVPSTREQVKTMRQRMASLSMSDQTDSMVRSCSFPIFENTASCSLSGHTTPTGSTSLSSATFTTDDGPVSGAESERFSSATLVAEQTRDRLTSSPPTLVSEEKPKSVQPLLLHLKLPSDTADATASTSPADSSVATRRAVRKCRQLSSQSAARTTSDTANGHSTNPLTSGHRAAKASLRGAVRQAHQSPRQHLPVPQRSQRSSDLDVLHDTTVARTTSVSCSSSLPSCNDPVLSSFTCHYQPVEMSSLDVAKRHAALTSDDPHIGHSNSPIPLALTQFLEMSKRVFMDHLEMFRSPQYVTHVQHQLELERARHSQLVDLTRTAEKTIERLHADGTELLRRFTSRLGILISTPSTFFAQARKLIKHHHTLEAKIAEFRKQIADLSAANQELVRRHQQEAARLLSRALHSSSYCLLSTPPELCVATSGESSILVRTLTDSAVPPPLTKYHASDSSSPSISSQCDRPPVLHRLTDRVVHSPNPAPPPPLLPMPPRSKHSPVVNHQSPSHGAHVTTKFNVSVQNLSVSEPSGPFSPPTLLVGDGTSHVFRQPTNQCNLPLRKRSWDSSLVAQAHKLPRTDASSTTSTLGPPTLSPIEPRLSSSSSGPMDGSKSSIASSPPLLYSQTSPNFRPSTSGVNQRNPPAIPLVVAQALGQ